MTREEAKNQIKIYYNNPNYYVEMDALLMAIEALEKQIPKEPIDSDYVLPVYGRDGCQADAIFMYRAKCPSCGEIIADGELEKSDLEDEKYCRNCGQAIDWSEEGE